VTGSCEYGNGILSLIKGVQILDEMSQLAASQETLCCMEFVCFCSLIYLTFISSLDNRLPKVAAELLTLLFCIREALSSIQEAEVACTNRGFS
jgi:hypothetical protein